MGVTAINDDITGLKVRLELGNEIVDSLTSLDEQDDLTGPLQFGDELFDRVGALDFGAYGDNISRSVGVCQTMRSLTFGLVRQKVVDFARRTVVCDDGEALVVHVENQVLTL